MKRYIFLIAILAQGCSSEATLQTSTPGPQESNRQESPIFDPSTPHATQTIALARNLTSRGYRLARYSDEAGVEFDQRAFTIFQESGHLPDGLQLFGKDGIGWSLDAQPPTSSDAVPDTPWYYDQSSMRGEWTEPFSPEIIARMRGEWVHARDSFGESVHDAGAKLLNISGVILSSPEEYASMPFVDIRSNEDCTFAEFLAFGGDYWLHVFVTEWRSPESSTIVTLSFTPHVPDQHAPPPPDSENLVLIDKFRAAAK